MGKKLLYMRMPQLYQRSCSNFPHWQISRIWIFNIWDGGKYIELLVSTIRDKGSLILGMTINNLFLLGIEVFWHGPRKSNWSYVKSISPCYKVYLPQIWRFRNDPKSWCFVRVRDEHFEWKNIRILMVLAYHSVNRHWS